MYSVKKLDYFLRYSSFTAYVDHATLKWLFSLHQPSGKFARWVTLLQSCTFEIQYRPGRAHGNADGVNRRIYDEPEPADLALDDYDPLLGLEFEFPTSAGTKTRHISAVSAAKVKQRTSKDIPDRFHAKAEEISSDGVLQMSKDEFIKEHGSDTNCKHLIAFLDKHKLPDEAGEAAKVLLTSDSYFLDDRILYHVHIQPGKGDRIARSTIQLVIPRQLAPNILREVHDSALTGGHLGIARTIEKARSKFFWTGMYQDTTNWVKSCDLCT